MLALKLATALLILLRSELAPAMADCALPGLPSTGDASMPLPTEGELVSDFGLRRHPLLGNSRQHDGVDYAAPIGTDVRAAGAGVVTLARTLGEFGNIIEITHGGGFTTRYAHLQKSFVTEGACIKRGEVLGAVGCTGLCTEPHVHFEILQHGKAIDPAPYLVNYDAQFADPAKHWRQVDRLKLIDTVAEHVIAKFLDKDLLGKIGWAEHVVKARADILASASADEAVQRINSLFGILKTSHTALYTPEDYEFYILPSTIGLPPQTDDLKLNRYWHAIPKLPTIGVFTRKLGHRFFVDGVLEGSAADKAGLRYGDEILTVDGAPYMPIGVFRGKVGKTVRLGVRLLSNGNIEQIDLAVSEDEVKKLFDTATEASARVIELRSKRIGYVHIWGLGSIDGFWKAQSKITSRVPLDSLIVDMRGRVGGNVAHASAILKWIDGSSDKMPLGEWSQTQKAVWHPYYKTLGAPSDVPSGRVRVTSQPSQSFRDRTLLLINEQTRSAGEMLTYGFRRNGLGAIVGTRTAGAVTSGAIRIMPGGLLLYVGTIGHLLDGVPLEGVGVAPDIHVERPLEYAGGGDPVLEAALETLRNRSR